MNQKVLQSTSVQFNDKQSPRKDLSQPKPVYNIAQPAIHKRNGSETAVKDYFLTKQQLRRDMNHFRGLLCFTETLTPRENPNKPSGSVNQQPTQPSQPTHIKRIYLPEVKDSKPQSPQGRMLSSRSPVTTSYVQLTNSPFSSAGFDFKMANQKKENGLATSRNFEQEQNKAHQGVESPKLGRTQAQFAQLISSKFSPYIKESQRRKKAMSTSTNYS